MIDIKFDSDYSPWNFHMSNFQTEDFIAALLLSGSALAETEEEKQMIVWLAEKDQGKVGMGKVSFRIIDMPWSRSGFEALKEFMLKTADEAMRHRDWYKLGSYTIISDSAEENLSFFRESIEHMTAEDVQEESRISWLEFADDDDPVRRGFPCCEMHGTLMSKYGCYICSLSD